MKQFNEPVKIYFAPGDIVTVKHNLPFKPVMLVKEKVTTLIKKTEGTHFQGMKCIWFNTSLELQESIFNTKDLIHYEAD